MNDFNFALPTELTPADTDQQWVQFFPSGTFFGIDGRGPYKIKAPESIIAASRREKTDLSIDRDHQRFFSPKGTLVTAAGWIKKFQVRDNGEIWGLVEWTSAAKYEISEKYYRYFSPEFVVDKNTGEILRITGGTLTNDPNFELAAVAASADRTTNPTFKENFKMKEFLKAMAMTLGLPETATETEIQAAAAERQAKLDALSKERTEAASALGLKDGQSFGDVAKEAASRQKTDVNPAQYVPMETYKETASALKSLQDELKKDKACIAVEAAMKEGKIAPAMKDWATEYASRDADGFAKFVKDAPVIVSAQAASRAPAKDETGLTDVEREVASSLGLSAEQYLGKKKDEAAAA